VTHDVWADGDAYEAYVGRWSRRVAEVFVPWLNVPAGRRWVDVGCGTGALTQAVLALADPAGIVSIDPSAGFLATAGERIDDPRVVFQVGDAQALPVPSGDADAVVSGLALNFVPDPDRAGAEFARVAASGAVVAAYVWDYAEGMELMRHFWDAATEVDPAAAQWDEGRRFPVCRPARLGQLWTESGLAGVSVEAIHIPTVFTGFDDYWLPFLGGQGAAPGYLTSLPEPQRDAVRERLRARLPVGPGGDIALSARAWAVRGLAQ
jgi:SAM-dependent methyltransferase